MKALLNRALLWTLTLAGIVCLPALAHAQVRYGSIVVEARDPSGGAVPGATVTIIESGTNRSRSGVTNSAGVVTFPTIPPGTYSVRVNLTGFKEFVTTDVAVTEDTVMRVSSQLEVGQITETMTISAAAAILQTDRAEVRTDIPAVQLENLPVPVGRNYQNLFVTVPGISPPENMHSVAVNPARGLAFSSNGTTRNANSIRIEGAISNNLWLPHVAAAQVVKDFLPITVHMHLKDFSGGEHFAGYCPLGQGKVDLQAILDMVEGANPNANIMVELDGSANMPYTALQTAQISKVYLQKLGYAFRTS